MNLEKLREITNKTHIVLSKTEPDYICLAILVKTDNGEVAVDTGQFTFARDTLLLRAVLDDMIEANVIKRMLNETQTPQPRLAKRSRKPKTTSKD